MRKPLAPLATSLIMDQSSNQPEGRAPKRRWVPVVLLVILFPVAAVHFSCVAVLGPGSWGSGVEEKTPALLAAGSKPALRQYIPEFAEEQAAQPEWEGDSSQLEGMVVFTDHLEEDEELDVVRTTTGIQEPEFEHTVTGPDLIAFQRLVRKVPVPDAVLRYAVNVVRTTRPSPNGKAPDFINKWVAFGASVRAAQYLILGGKARALTQGRYNVSFEDIRALAHPVLRHRILTNFHAESEGVTTAELVDQLIEAVAVPPSGL